MSLKFGQELLAIPGPSVIPQRVLGAMHQAAPDIYAGELMDMSASLFPDLKAVAKTQGNCAIYVGNGHAAWEAGLVNTLNRGDHILVLSTGRFAANWGVLAEQLGLQVETQDFGMRADADPAWLTDRLAQDKTHQIKAVLTVQTDTASSVRNDIPALRAAIDAANHPALFMVDCICSLATEPHFMDDWGVDVMIAASQKGLMCPPGLAFCFFNEKADAARDHADPSWYWCWRRRMFPEIFSDNYGGTAPTHHIFALREALDMIAEEGGIEAVVNRHQILANAVWAAVDTWSQSGGLHHNIEDHAKRSLAVSAITAPDNGGLMIRQWCQDVAGVTLGIGLGFKHPNKDISGNYFRIGHMGHVNAHMVMGTLGAIEAAMIANGITHGSGGLSAAAKALGRVQLG